MVSKEPVAVQLELLGDAIQSRAEKAAFEQVERQVRNRVSRRAFIRQVFRVGTLGIIVTLAVILVPRYIQTPRTPTSPGSRNDAPPFECASPPASTNGSTPLVASLEASRNVLDDRRSIRLTMKLTNEGSATVRFLFNGGSVEYWARRDGTAVWNWHSYFAATGGVFPDNQVSVPLRPGQTYTTENPVDWTGVGCEGQRSANGRVLEGDYEVLGAWTIFSEGSRHVVWSEPVRVTIS